MTEEVIQEVAKAEEVESDIVYVTHPCTPERKAEFRKQGKKIIDAQFAPEGAKIEKGDPKAKGAK